jgi:hypothetical protein
MKRIALMLLAILVPTAAIAGTTSPAKSGEDELKTLRREIAAAKLDRQLDLSRDQARAMLPVLKEAVQLKGQMRAEHERRRPEIARALSSVRDDYLRVGQVSDADRKGLQEARGDSALKDTKEQMRGLRQRIRGMLTPDQKARLREFDASPLDGGRRHFQDERGERRARPMKTLLSAEFAGLVEGRAR